MSEPGNRKKLRVDAARCTGCRLCEIACSLYNEGMCNPALSKICVIRWEEAVDFPLVCQQCEEAPCITSCPAEARMPNEETGAVHVDRRKCIGCRMCIYACPFGAISVRPEDGTTTNCLLCNGEPRCVQVCDTRAIQYLAPSEESEALLERAREALKAYRATLE